MFPANSYANGFLLVFYVSRCSIDENNLLADSKYMYER